MTERQHQELQTIFEDRCASDDAVLRRFSMDQVGNPEYYHRPSVVVFPETTKEAAALMKWASRHRIPVTPRGAGSGLSGGAIPVEGGVVCAFEKMNRIVEIDPENMMATVEPGVVTNHLDKALEPYGLFFAGYPMSEDLCFIGGNVAENAGGGRAVRYGVTGNYVLAAEVVTPDGEIMQLGGKRLKDVSGYNLLPLFIGSEGTLGLFTRITLRLEARPAGRGVALLGFNDTFAAVKAVAAVKAAPGLRPSSIEFMDGPTVRETVSAMMKAGSVSPPGAEGSWEALLLVEIEADSGLNAPVELERRLEQVAGLCAGLEGTVLESGIDPDSMRAAWELRKRIPWQVKVSSGPHHSLEDVVVPPAAVPELAATVVRLRDDFGIPIAMFGHAGDGNFHVTPMRGDAVEVDSWPDTLKAVLEQLYADVRHLGGTISGEHGIGRKRTSYLASFLDPGAYMLMKEIKKMMDPHNILNPGVVFTWWDDMKRGPDRLLIT